MRWIPPPFPYDSFLCIRRSNWASRPDRVHDQMTGQVKSKTLEKTFKKWVFKEDNPIRLTRILFPNDENLNNRQVSNSPSNHSVSFNLRTHFSIILKILPYLLWCLDPSQIEHHQPLNHLYIYDWSLYNCICITIYKWSEITTIITSLQPLLSRIFFKSD